MFFYKETAPTESSTLSRPAARRTHAEQKKRATQPEGPQRSQGRKERTCSPRLLASPPCSRPAGQQPRRARPFFSPLGALAPLRLACPLIRFCVSSAGIVCGSWICNLKGTSLPRLNLFWSTHAPPPHW